MMSWQRHLSLLCVAFRHNEPPIMSFIILVPWKRKRFQQTPEISYLYHLIYLSVTS